MDRAPIAQPRELANAELASIHGGGFFRDWYLKTIKPVVDFLRGSQLAPKP